MAVLMRLELVTGRMTWAEAVGTGRVSASGNRADLSAHLPLTVAQNTENTENTD